jgi:integrase
MATCTPRCSKRCAKQEEEKVLHQSKLMKYPRGRHSDGNNLYVRITRPGAGSFYYRSNKYEEGLGPIDLITLAEAREKAAAIRKKEWAGLDLKEERRNAELGRQIAKRMVKTVKELWDEFRDVKYRTKAPGTVENVQCMMRKHVLDRIGDLRTDQVTTITITDDDGVGLQTLFWKAPTMARPVQRLICRMLSYARRKGYPVQLDDGKNPAEWKDHLEHILDVPDIVTRNNTWLPYLEIGAYMAKLRACADPLARLIELIILTGVRTSEVRLAEWREFDLLNMVWNVPWEHLKTGRKNKRTRPVPITPQMLRVLEEMQRRRTDPSDTALVFPSPRGGPYHLSTCSEFTRTKVDWKLVLCPDGVKRNITLHGFRSSLRDWCRAEGYPKEWWDIQVNHKLGKDESDAAYGHDPLLNQRRVMMEAWGKFCDRPTPATGTGNVAQINEAREKRRRSA